MLRSMVKGQLCDVVGVMATAVDCPAGILSFRRRIANHSNAVRKSCIGSLTTGRTKSEMAVLSRIFPKGGRSHVAAAAN